MRWWPGTGSWRCRRSTTRWSGASTPCERTDGWASHLAVSPSLADAAQAVGLGLAVSARTVAGRQEEGARDPSVARPGAWVAVAPMAAVEVTVRDGRWAGKATSLLASSVLVSVSMCEPREAASYDRGRTRLRARLGSAELVPVHLRGRRATEQAGWTDSLPIFPAGHEDWSTEIVRSEGMEVTGQMTSQRIVSARYFSSIAIASAGWSELFSSTWIRGPEARTSSLFPTTESFRYRITRFRTCSWF